VCICREYYHLHLKEDKYEHTLSGVLLVLTAKEEVMIGKQEQQRTRNGDNLIDEKIKEV
jgi:hypothetical protein